jgi:hypothetical protein
MGGTTFLDKGVGGPPLILTYTTHYVGDEEYGSDGAVMD